MSFSALVAEIKELKDKTQQEDNVLISIAAGCKHHISPNLVFDYADKGIHEDYYKLIKYSCNEICTSKEQSNKAMRLWCTLLESMLNVPYRPLGSEDTEVASVSKHHGITSAGTSIRGREETLVADAAHMNFKQLKSLSNGGNNTSPKQVDFRMISLLNSDKLAKDEFGLPKDLIHAFVVDKAASDHLASSDAAIRDDKTPPRVGVELGVFFINLCS